MPGKPRHAKLQPLDQEAQPDRGEPLSIAVSAAEIGTFRLDFGTGSVDADATLNRILGLEPRRSIQALDQILVLIHPEDRLKVRTQLEQCASRGVDFQTESRIIRADGAIRWVRCRGKALRDPKGKVVALVGAVVDLTGEKEALLEAQRNQERLITTAKVTNIGFWYTDLPARTPYADENTRKLFWIPPDSALTHDLFLSRLHPEDRPRIRATIEDAIRRGAEYDVEYRIVSPLGTGEMRWIRAIARVIVDPKSGTKIRFDGVALDITQIKHAEERLQALVSAAAQVVYFTDARGEALDDNPSWQRFTGQSRAEIATGHWSDAVHPLDRKTVVETVSHALARRIPYQVENRLRRFDGQWRHMLVRGIPLLDANGNVREWVGACQDITERKQLEIDLRTAVATRDEFISVASHEMKSPLTALSLRLQLLCRLAREERAGAGEQIAFLAELSLKATQQLSSLLDDLLDFSRIRAGKLMLFKQKVDLKASVENILSLLSEEIARSRSTIKCSVPRPVIGIWDQNRVNQVISNLVSNALKYGEGKPIEVSAYVDEGSNNAKLEVKDQGIGIPPEKHQAIFQRFERAVSETKIGGLGLGLYIVRQIVEAHEGSIHVESDLGKGALFVVELPLAS